MEYTDEEKEILGITGDDQDDLEQGPDDLDQDQDDLTGDDDKDDAQDQDDGEGETEHKEEGQGEDKDLANAHIEGKYLVYEDGTRIPLTRFGKVYKDSQEAARRLELIKEIGPEEYFKIYPDEAPQGGTENQGGGQEQPNPGQENAGDPMMGLGDSAITGGYYDGWTLNQVFEVDATAATLLLMNHLNGIQTQADAERAAVERYNQEAETEATQLSNTLAQEIGGKDYATLKPEDQKKVDTEVLATVEWMKRENKTHFNLADAYYLKNRDDILKKARMAGAKETIASITRPTVPSIKVGTGTPQPAGSAFDDMGDDELAATIDAMSERQYGAFLRNASATLRQRLPDLPWA